MTKGGIGRLKGLMGVGAGTAAPAISPSGYFWRLPPGTDLTSLRGSITVVRVVPNTIPQRRFIYVWAPTGVTFERARRLGTRISQCSPGDREHLTDADGVPRFIPPGMTRG